MELWLSDHNVEAAEGVEPATNLRKLGEFFRHSLRAVPYRRFRLRPDNE